MNDFNGHWHLVGYRHFNDELPLTDSETGADDIHSWLLGSDNIVRDVPTATGLKIQIDGNTFSEAVKSFDDLMFDIEGIQVNDYQPMAGTIHFVADIGFVRPDGVPDYASPQIKTDLAARYSDGDTIVGDTLRRAGDNLIRQISVVTDELYVDRIVLVYRLAAGA